jgi:hypothetical protein
MRHLRGISYNGKAPYSLNETDLTTEKVKDVVKKFYSEEDWKSLYNLKV